MLSEKNFNCVLFQCNTRRNLNINVYINNQPRVIVFVSPPPPRWTGSCYDFFYNDLYSSYLECTIALKPEVTTFFFFYSNNLLWLVITIMTFVVRSKSKYYRVHGLLPVSWTIVCNDNFEEKKCLWKTGHNVLSTLSCYGWAPCNNYFTRVSDVCMWACPSLRFNWFPLISYKKKQSGFTLHVFEKKIINPDNIWSPSYYYYFFFFNLKAVRFIYWEQSLFSIIIEFDMGLCHRRLCQK